VRANRTAVDARCAESVASTAKGEAIANLRTSLITEARSIRRTGWAGQRFDALLALERAASIRPSLEIRNEAIAAMALPDLRLVRRFPPIEPSCAAYFDSD